MKLAYVTPRYGPEVNGGAERATLMLAENVRRHLDWPVEIFTSCALDADTWADHYEPGTSQINGVTVHRFPVGDEGRRADDFDAVSQRVLANPAASDPASQMEWFEKQGPTSAALVDAVVGSDADLIGFYPYLYHPTVAGLPKVAERSFMHPAAHDEPPIRLSVFQAVFAATQAFVFQTDAERKVVEDHFSVAHKPQLKLGLGVERHEGDHAAFRALAGLDDEPYVLCLGRVDIGKGAHLAADWFRQYKRRHPSALKLVFVGPIVHPIDNDDDVVTTGPVDESVKWGALEGAELLVSPSPNESFSIVLLEAWAAGLAVMVNAVCQPTKEHCRASGGGLWFDGYLSFETCLERLLTDARLRESMAKAGGAYVERAYSWPQLMERYGAFLESLPKRPVTA